MATNKPAPDPIPASAPASAKAELTQAAPPAQFEMWPCDLLVGLTGPVGSGVSTVSRLLESHFGFHRVSVSEQIKKDLRKSQGHDDKLPFEETMKPGWRKGLQDIGDEGRKLHGSEHWVSAALTMAKGKKKIVVDGIRNVGEVQFLRDHFPNCFIMAVVASRDVRFRRVQGEFNKSLKEFEIADSRDADGESPEGQQVDKCVQEADYVLWNEDDLGAKKEREGRLQKRLIQELNLMEGKSSRYPDADEVFMSSAYATAYSSRCLKRFVGAVIVDQNGLPLSMGYNENPVGMKPCVHHYEFCFKDNNMHARLEGMGKIYCPDCGTEIPKLAEPWRCSKCGCNIKLRFFPGRNMELCTAIHAEERAIRSLGGRSAIGATMYVTTFPCLQCSRYIVDAGIVKVVFVEAYPVIEAAAFLQENGVKVEPFEGFKARAFNRVFRQRS